MIALLRAELRKTLSTRLWWALGIPVLALSIVNNLFGAVLAGDDDLDTAVSIVQALSLSVTMTLTAVFGAVAGIIAAAGEFRHHTATTTYLLSPSRGQVLLAKMALSALVGAFFATLAALVGVPAGLVAGTAGVDPGLLLAIIGIGMLVCALWAGIGAALGTAIGNQVGALVTVLIYLLLVDRVVAVLLSNSDWPVVAAISSYLPGKSADVAVYGVLVRGLGLPGVGISVVEQIASVSSPPPWWGALLVLAGWAVAAGVIGWLLGARRDIT